LEGDVAYQHFTEMPVWQTAHKLVLMVYRLSSSFPKDEQYAFLDLNKIIKTLVG